MFFHFCVRVRFRGNLFSEPLLRNRFRAFILWALHSNGHCLQSPRLAKGLYATISHGYASITRGVGLKELLRHSCMKLLPFFFTYTGQYIILVNALQSACSRQFVDVVVQIFWNSESALNLEIIRTLQPVYT